MAQRPVRHLGAHRGDPPRGEGPVALLVDAGPLYAYFDADDRHHRACRKLLETDPGPLIVPTLVVTEVAHFIGTRLGAEAEMRLLSDFGAGLLSAEPVHAADWLRMAELVWKYRDLPLGTVDASVVTAAERLGMVSIATLDRRHLTVVRPQHIPAFELLP